MNAITIVVELEDSKIESFERILKYWMNLRDDFNPIVWK